MFLVPFYAPYEFSVLSCQFSASAELTPRMNYFFFAAFLAAFFGAAFLPADFFAFGVASCSSLSAAFTFLGFASFLGSSGALKLCPPNAISAMRTAVNDWRCPRSFLYCFLRL